MKAQAMQTRQLQSFRTQVRLAWTIAGFYAVLLRDIEFSCDTRGGMPFAVWDRLLGTDEVGVCA